jgi:hypothetical protein
MWRAVLLMVVSAVAAGQDATMGSIAGIVVEAATGLPLSNVPVRLNPRPPGNSPAVTDDRGRFKLANLPPRAYIVEADVAGRAGQPPPTRMVTLRPGQNLSSIVLPITGSAVISGHVLDQNKEPVADMMVALLRQEYFAGALRFVALQTVNADSEGEYRLECESGQTYFLAAQKRPLPAPPPAETPAEPALRRLAYVPTWYPNGLTPDAGQPLTLRPGEFRDGVDFVMRRATSLCFDGLLQPAFRFELTPLAGWSDTLYTQRVSRLAPSGPDGKIRVCSLAPGDYRLDAWETSPENRSSLAFFASSIVHLGQEDLHNVKAAEGQRVPMAGEVVVDGTVDSPPAARLTLELESVPRGWMSENASVRGLNIPGPFRLGDVVTDDYTATVTGIPAGYYLKDLTYGGSSVFNREFHAGAGAGHGWLRVILGNDAGEIRAQVADRDGNPDPDCMVFAVPANTASAADFWKSLVVARTTPDASWYSGSLAPGKYLVIATTPIRVDPTPTVVGRLMRARSHMTEVTVTPHGKVQLVLETRPSLD